MGKRTPPALGSGAGTVGAWIPEGLWESTGAGGGGQRPPQGQRPLRAPWGNRAFPLGSSFVTLPRRSGSLCVLMAHKSIPEMWGKGALGLRKGPAPSSG